MNNAAPAAPKSRRLRPGLYETTCSAGETWVIEEREVDPGYGGGWEWFAMSLTSGAALDPTPTKAEALAALALPM